tara:strand:- start:124 stop:654 length:531 start_codon:yes stop_codon:yes gene_type:complete
MDPRFDRALEREIQKAERDSNHCCRVCGQKTNLVCEGCLIARFCSKQCQRQAWTAEHRRLCGPTKLVLDQIKEKKFTYVPGRRQNRHFVKNAAEAIARGLAIKEPSFKANGRLRGKQPRCTEKACKEPAAIGVRYASYLGDKACACASCWSAVVLRRNCDTYLRLTRKTLALLQNA